MCHVMTMSEIRRWCREHGEPTRREEDRVDRRGEDEYTREIDEDNGNRLSWPDQG